LTGIVPPEDLTALPLALRNSGCEACSRRVSMWTLASGPVCARCLLLRSPWGVSHAEGVAALVRAASGPSGDPDNPADRTLDAVVAAILVPYRLSARAS